MKPIRAYSGFVSNHPWLLLVLIILLTFIAIEGQKRVGTESMDNMDLLPDDIEAVQNLNILKDNFGGTDSIMIAIEIEPVVSGSSEVRDIRDPEVINYLYVLSRMAEHTDEVISVESAGTLINDLNNGIIPKSKKAIVYIVKENSALQSYISKDYTLSIIKISLTTEYKDNKIVDDLQKIIDQVPGPSGLKVSVAGDVATGPVIEDSIGADMQKTSRFSVIGIIIVLFLLFFSIRYALTPLAVIGLGIIWAFGFLGFIGKNISPITSGAVSMIMCVGIDFGIQTISRFRSELKNNRPSKAMENTLNAVFMPMATTSIASLIGFKAMSMGNITVLSELADIMSYGIVFCFFAAITVIPPISIIGERLSKKIKNKFLRRYKK